jgi:hypothetical protein
MCCGKYNFKEERVERRKVGLREKRLRAVVK